MAKTLLSMEDLRWRALAEIRATGLLGRSRHRNPLDLQLVRLYRGDHRFDRLRSDLLVVRSIRGSPLSRASTRSSTRWMPSTMRPRPASKARPMPDGLPSGPRHDDGGYCGGSTDCPNLRRLLEDVRARKIDVIVVYKVDRLTR
jgi:hypothetical protein